MIQKVDMWRTDELRDMIFKELLEHLEDCKETVSVHVTSHDCKMFNAGVEKCIRVVKQLQEEV